MEAHSRHWPILILTFGLWLMGGAWVQAQTVENIKVYGNCSTGTHIDLLTDEESPLLLCTRRVGNDPSRQVSLFIGTDQTGPLGIRLMLGEQFHPDPSIAVALRIDNGPIIRRTAIWQRAQQIARIIDPDLARSLLNGLAIGQRVIIRVGVEQGYIPLAGSALAIADFRSRIRP